MKALIGACGPHIHCDATLFNVCMHVKVGLGSGGRVKQMCEHNLEAPGENAAHIKGRVDNFGVASNSEPLKA